MFALASKLMRDIAPGVSAPWYIHESASDALFVVEAFGLGDALIGVLTLYAPRQAFSDDHGRLVQMIAPHLAQAIAHPSSPFRQAPCLMLALKRHC